MRPSVPLAAVGAAIWVVTTGRLDAWSVALGLAVGGAAAAVAPAREPGAGVALSFRGRLRLAARLLGQVATGSWQVALVAAGIRPVPEPRLIEVAIGRRPRVDPDLLALLETFTPSTYLVDHDTERGVMVFHVFDARDAAAVERRYAADLRGDEGETR